MPPSRLRLYFRIWFDGPMIVARLSQPCAHSVQDSMDTAQTECLLWPPTAAGWHSVSAGSQPGIFFALWQRKAPRTVDMQPRDRRDPCTR